MPKLDLLLDGFIANGLVGCSLLVFKGNSEKYYYQTGFKDIENKRSIQRDDIYRIYSMTKSLVCFGMMILIQKGKVSLDDSVANFIPELNDLEVYVSGKITNQIVEKNRKEMTIKNLMTHQAGLTYGSEITPVHQLVHEKLWMNPETNLTLDSDDIIQKLKEIPLYYHPGENWHYSIAIDVLGIVIERISKKTLNMFLEENVFGPLRMKDTGFSIAKDQVDRLTNLYKKLDSGYELVENNSESLYLKNPLFFSGGGSYPLGLVSTIDDYMKYLNVLNNNGKSFDKIILNTEFIKEFIKSQTGNSSLDILEKNKRGDAFNFGNGSGLGHGLGGAVVTKPSESIFKSSPSGEFFWCGYAFTHFWIEPKERLSVVFMTQMANLYQTKFGNNMLVSLKDTIYNSF